MATQFEDASAEQVASAAQSSLAAFRIYRRQNLKQRAAFLHQIARELETISAQLIEKAAEETHLAEARLKIELKRTLFQLDSYADACELGSWLDIRMDTANPQRQPPKPDLRKMLIPLGPVAVFGASNFPFAYSTAGGDTACALAAGCPVILKAHPAHAATSQLVADAIGTAAEKCGLPPSVFIHLHGSSFEVGKALVLHPLVKAVGFTGSFEGGKAIFDLAAQRPVPIPVFAEMGSVNPVFILPDKLKTSLADMARMCADSITQSAGQFCTNPGLLVAIDTPELKEFTAQLSAHIRDTRPQLMLHRGIAASFHEKRSKALSQQNTELVAESSFPSGEEESIPTLAQAPAADFLSNPVLHKEVFGPFSLLVVCQDQQQMQEVAANLEGQLTATLLATEEEMRNHAELVETLKEACGRLIWNGVPTGVEVALSMHHGGPFPATTDPRFTAVGADGIKRFCRPLCYQNWSNELLPDELKNENPLGLWRTVNNELIR